MANRWILAGFPPVGHTLRGRVEAGSDNGPMNRRQSARRRLLALVVGPLLLAVAACAGAAVPPEEATAATAEPTAEASTPEQSPTEPTPAEPSEQAATPAGAEDGVADPGARAAALALAPGGTAYLTITDWQAIRARHGASDLTSDSIQTDRIEFWRSISHDTVLLTDGALRAENSRLGLRSGVTQDDVRWEVRWTGPGSDQAGMVLRLRDDLDLAGLTRAVADDVPGVAGAEVLPGERLLLRGAGDPGDPLAGNTAVGAVLGDAVESLLVVPGCLTWPDALGVDATIEDQDAVVAGQAVDDLLDIDAWSLGFTGRDAVARLAYPAGTDPARVEADAQVRLALSQDWPTTESVGWYDAFGLPPGDGPYVRVSEQDGRPVATFEHRVVNTTAAATVALAALVPLAVCAEIDWLAEPTGL